MLYYPIVKKGRSFNQIFCFLLLNKEGKMKKKEVLKHFEGLSHLVVNKNGGMIKFCTDKATEEQAACAIRHGMNKMRGCISSASLPVAIMAVKKCTK
jgi:hypothetical protein